MKKLLGIAVLCGLAFGMVACGEDSKDCLNQNPAIVDEATKLDTALKADVVTASAEVDCIKFASNMANYLADGSDNLTNLKNAITGLKDYYKSGDIVSNIFCTGIDGIKIYRAANIIKTDYDQAQVCTETLASGETAEEQEAVTKLNAGIQTLSTVDGWDNVLTAAAKATQENQNAQQGN